ncbi:hypothetical protein, partial [Kitasatospora sp. MBT63]|uniref:hypothetical protein n=1 Tax=Kitasatospora sp. MBT63 TaxID=1444768 RepID=UPI00053B4E09
VLAVNVCRTRDGAPSTRKVNNLILQSFLADAGLRTVCADKHLFVVHPDLELPAPTAASAAPRAARPTPAVMVSPPRRRQASWFPLIRHRRA